jgi:hypothetical protein
MDYRKLTGERFDAVVSIGMVEHGGSVQIDLYAQQLAGLLEPEGRLLNHGIARVRHGDPEAGPSSGRYGFPNAAPLHLSRVLGALERAGFATEHVEGFTADYAETLTHWLTRLEDLTERRPSGSPASGASAPWGSTSARRAAGSRRFHVGLPSPRAFGLKDWRLLSPDEAGEPPSTKFYELRDNVPGSSTWG